MAGVTVSMCDIILAKRKRQKETKIMPLLFQIMVIDTLKIKLPTYFLVCTFDKYQLHK